MSGHRKVANSREAQQKCIVMNFCIIIAVILISIIFLRSTSAQAAPTEVSSKYFTSIQVEAGDTLWTIATEHITDEYSDIHEYMNEVCSINHISADEIHAGQYIVIPYYAVSSAQ